MRAGFIFHVARKEILSTLRDRRAILSTLLIPFLILPLLTLGLPFLLGGLFERETRSVSEVAVVGLEGVPRALREGLEVEAIRLVEVSDPFTAVETGAFLAALELTPGFAEAVGSNRTDADAKLTIYSKRGNLRSELTAGKVEAAVSAYRDRLVAERLVRAGLDERLLEPLTLETVDASSREERASGPLAWLVPFFIVIWTLAGGQMAAIDATAGEKERGTLEVLLVTPVRRAEVVVGKWLATAGFGLAAALMAILGYLLSGAVLRRFLGGVEGEGEVAALLGGSLSVGPLATLLLVVSSLLLAGLVAALLISITTFARSFKEAQTYVAPLSFVLIIPLVGLQFADFFDFGLSVYLVPLLNSMLFIDGVVKGEVSVLPLVFTWGSTLGYTALFLDFAYRSFRREGVLFRT